MAERRRVVRLTREVCTLDGGRRTDVDYIEIEDEDDGFRCLLPGETAVYGYWSPEALQKGEARGDLQDRMPMSDRVEEMRDLVLDLAQWMDQDLPPEGVAELLEHAYLGPLRKGRDRLQATARAVLQRAAELDAADKGGAPQAQARLDAALELLAAALQGVDNDNG